MSSDRIRINALMPIAVLVIFSAVLLIAARPEKKPTNSRAEKAPQTAEGPLLILTKAQPDSPLAFSDIVVDESPDSKYPVVTFTITNRSDKHIMAYAIRQEAAVGKTTLSSAEFTPNSDKGRALRRGHSIRSSIDLENYREPVISMTLSVDFAEFVDGTRWGPDFYKFAEQLDGVRAGAREERDALLRVLETSGPQAMVRHLESIAVEAPDASQHSAEWLRGFNNGVRWVRWRTGLKKENPSEIENELRRLID